MGSPHKSDHLPPPLHRRCRRSKKALPACHAFNSSRFFDGLTIEHYGRHFLLRQSTLKVSDPFSTVVFLIPSKAGIQGYIENLLGAAFRRNYAGLQAQSLRLGTREGIKIRKPLPIAKHGSGFQPNRAPATCGHCRRFFPVFKEFSKAYPASAPCLRSVPYIKDRLWSVKRK